MQNPPPVQTGKSSTGLDENIASLLSYVFGWLSGLIFFLIEKESRLVRFHAMQSILFNVLIAVAAVVLGIVIFILVLILGQLSDVLAGIASLISFLFWLGFFIVVAIMWILCLIKAYQGTMYKLPVIGNFAEKFSAKPIT
jgi:uncharacterized membrane protein